MWTRFIFILSWGRCRDIIALLCTRLLCTRHHSIKTLRWGRCARQEGNIAIALRRSSGALGRDRSRQRPAFTTLLAKGLDGAYWGGSEPPIFSLL
jgi:hypothetical protein